MHAVYRNGKYEVKSSLFHFSCSSRQEVSARRIVVKRQVTVATLMVSSTVMLSSCVADIGTRSASEEPTKVDESGGISSTDGAGGANGDPGDDAEGNQGETAHTNGGKNADGAGQPGEAGATGSEDTSGVLPPLGEFDPAQPGFQVFDPCTEISEAQLKERKIERFGKPDFVESGHKGCSYKAFPEGTEFSITAFREQVDSKPELLVQIKEKQEAGVVISRGEVFSNSMCRASASTVRGVVTLTVSDFSSNIDQICYRANELFNELI